jgi:hypothetical protein
MDLVMRSRLESGLLKVLAEINMETKRVIDYMEADETGLEKAGAWYEQLGKV